MTQNRLKGARRTSQINTVTASDNVNMRQATLRDRWLQSRELFEWPILECYKWNVRCFTPDITTRKLDFYSMMANSLQLFNFSFCHMMLTGLVRLVYTQRPWLWNQQYGRFKKNACREGTSKRVFVAKKTRTDDPKNDPYVSEWVEEYVRRGKREASSAVFFFLSSVYEGRASTLTLTRHILRTTDSSSRSDKFAAVLLQM